MNARGELSYDLNTELKRTMALVLAGGRGTRLMNLTDSEAKPAIPFAGKFRIIDFPLSNCIHSGIRKIAVPTQYKAHSLIQHVQRGWGFLRAELQEFVEIWPAQQQRGEEWYRGTADAIFQNIDMIRSYDLAYILVLAGDHVYKQNYSRMLAQHIERGADVTVACVEVPKASATQFGVVGVDENDRIVEFLEKPADPPAIPGQPGQSFASMGIYIFNAPVLVDQLERDAADETSSHDFGKDILPYLINKAKVYAHRFKDSCVRKANQEPYWRDVGTLDAYWAANIDLTRVTPELDLYDEDWPIWTYQAQRPAAKFVFDDEKRRGMAVDSLVSAGCIISGGAVRRSLLFTSVRVNSYSVVEDSVILPFTIVGRRARLRKVVVDRDCVIPEGLVVGEDPELDARRFHRTEAGVTLVTKQMLETLPPQTPPAE